MVVLHFGAAVEHWQNDGGLNDLQDDIRAQNERLGMGHGCRGRQDYVLGSCVGNRAVLSLSPLPSSFCPYHFGKNPTAWYRILTKTTHG